jgi:hypothetical protein
VTLAKSNGEIRGAADVMKPRILANSRAAVIARSLSGLHQTAARDAIQSMISLVNDPIARFDKRLRIARRPEALPP